MMTSRGFDLIAAALRETMPIKSYYPEKYIQWECDVNAIMRALTQDNPGFSARRFLIACGVET